MKSSKWRTIEFLKEEGAQRSFSIVSNVYGQPIQVMDSETYEMLELDDEAIRDSNPGDTVHLLKVEDSWYYVPDSMK
jgi:NMD protein affecting ribosome stability and mRNA decay